MERAVIIFNPKARNAPTRERLRAAADLYRIHGWQIDLLPTEAPGHATVLAREAANAEASVIFSCGGDGTLNEVINGVVHTPARLSLIRGGTGNVFAKEIHLGRTPERALRVLVEGEEGRFDLGKANDRYFLLMSSLGFDAAVVRKVPSATKRILGSASYVLWGVAEVARYRGMDVRIRIDDEDEQEVHLYWLLLGNTRSYGGVLNVAHEAIADDGLLDAYIFAGSHIPLTTAARLAMQRQEGAPGVSFKRISRLEVATPGIPVQADGEFFGETPMTFTIEQQVLTVLMPPGQGRQLLTPPVLSLRAREQRLKQATRGS